MFRNWQRIFKITIKKEINEIKLLKCYVWIYLNIRESDIVEILKIITEYLEAEGKI